MAHQVGAICSVPRADTSPLKSEVMRIGHSGGFKWGPLTFLYHYEQKLRDIKRLPWGICHANSDDIFW